MLRVRPACFAVDGKLLLGYRESMYFFGLGRRGLAFSLIIIVLGLGLIFGCIRGLMNREGMYDSESSNIMLWSQILGILIGVVLVAWGIRILASFGGLF